MNDFLDNANQFCKHITIWGSPRNSGDGEVYIAWYLTEELAINDQANLDEGWGGYCHFMVETYEGSNIHNDALNQSEYDKD